MRRLLFLLFTIPVFLISVVIIGSQRSQPANAGGVIDPTCISSLPCIEYDNNGTGPAIRGVALGGNGLAGSTHINSTSATNARAGVFGKDDSTSGSFNAGVRGVSVRGTGVAGQSSTGIGVQGSSTANFGANIIGGVSNGTSFLPALSIVVNAGTGANPTPNLIDACSPGVFSCERNVSTPPVFEVTSDGSVGGFGHGNFFAGMTIDHIGENALFVLGGASSSPTIQLENTTTPSDLIQMLNSQAEDVFRVDDGGNVFITGKITTSGTCSVGCAKPATAPGYHVASYVPSESLPTVEDTGEAQLVNGAAYVHIDPAFANVIDKTASYVVLITPEGPSRGVYVTQKTPTGFAVMENPGGHATVAFSYRIVAKPYGSTAARLPMLYMRKAQAHQPHQPGGLRPG